MVLPKIPKRSCTGKTGNDQGGSCREKAMLPEVGFQKKISAYTGISGKKKQLLDADTYSVSPTKVPAHTATVLP